MSNFQLIVTGLFVTFVIVGVGVFALFGGIGGKGSTGPVVVWGTVEQGTMDAVLTSLSNTDKSYQEVRYFYHKPSSYASDLINAIAAGQGPDLIFMSQADIGILSDKTTPIPYGAMSQSDFIASYIDEGQLFLTSQGILALPVTIDPLVMYWNRDVFTSVGAASPPQYWTGLRDLAPKITALDAGSNIRKSAVALGTWSNIYNAKPILSALMMQTGDFITNRSQTGTLTTTLGGKAQNGNDVPAASALQFYTDFANPSKLAYSWNRSLPEASQAFVSGDTAVYFGFASEYRPLAERNPNLRFGIAPLPQLEGSSSKITFGTIQGLAIARGSRNPQGALIAALKLSGAPAVAALAQKTGLPPVRRDVQADTSASAAAATFVQSALMSRSWADPNSASTDAVFKLMIESVSSGKSGPEQAVYDAAQAFRQLLPNK